MERFDPKSLKIPWNIKIVTQVSKEEEEENRKERSVEEMENKASLHHTCFAPNVTVRGKHHSYLMVMSNNRSIIDANECVIDNRSMQMNH